MKEASFFIIISTKEITKYQILPSCYKRQKIEEPMDKIWLRLIALKAKLFDDAIIIQEPSTKVKDIFTTLKIIMPIKLGV